MDCRTNWNTEEYLKIQKIKRILILTFFRCRRSKTERREIEGYHCRIVYSLKSVKKYRDIDIWILWNPEPCYCQAYYGTEHIFECIPCTV